jgi:hypothetical protein
MQNLRRRYGPSIALQGGEVLTLTVDAATIRRKTGAVLTYRRPAAPGDFIGRADDMSHQQTVYHPSRLTFGSLPSHCFAAVSVPNRSKKT